jgi:hypothetical protein
MNEQKQSRLGLGLAVIGGCLLAYFLVTATQAFAPIVTAVRARGITDPSFAGAVVGETLVTATIRGAFALPALLLLTLALVATRYRARWFFWFICIASAALVPLFPVGTAFAVFLLVYALRRRHEFRRANEPTGIT